jgi:hypothetical protein
MMTSRDLPEPSAGPPVVDPRVAESRRRVEERISDLRNALHSDVGWIPHSGAWVVPVLGFAVGFGLAMSAFRRRRRRR